jgi:uncharacterized SAM-binding protein YcdF (DUF218 family)
MLPGELKPILTALVLPPAAPLLLALLGLVLAARRRLRTGLALVFAAVAVLWFLSCHAVALLLAQAVLPQVEPIRPDRLAQAQAIVVLGAAVQTEAPEYGAAQPSALLLGRLRYGATLARRTGKPLAFAGGVGWSSARTDMPPEAEVAARALKDFGATLRWADARSRDTEENAGQMKKLLAADGITRIALVTDAWHMPRSVLEFERAGFDVAPAPTGFPSAHTRPLLGWLPSADGLGLSRQVLREALGLWVAQRR